MPMTAEHNTAISQTENCDEPPNTPAGMCRQWHSAEHAFAPIYENLASALLPVVILVRYFR